MCIKSRIKRFDFQPSWRVVDENSRFKSSHDPDPLLYWCHEALCVNWSLRWLGSSSDCNFHPHVLELVQLDSGLNSSNQLPNPTQWHMMNTILQEFWWFRCRILKIEEREIWEGSEKSRSRMWFFWKFCYDLGFIPPPNHSENLIKLVLIKIKRK